jgi:phage/conjugal plasmid C-4 type zinc finger TraR family protein
MAPDEMDQVQANVLQQQSDSLAECFRRGIRNAMDAHEVLHCVNCDEEIPLARRKAVPGTERCVVCQADFELLTHWR